MSYDPEQLDAFEIGFKSTLADGRAQLNGAVYYYDYRDYQAFNIVGIDTLTINTDAESMGAELELQANPMPGLDILLGAAWNDIDVDLDGRSVSSVQSPEWNLNALVRYEWPAFGGKLAVQADAGLPFRTLFRPDRGGDRDRNRLYGYQCVTVLDVGRSALAGNGFRQEPDRRGIPGADV